VQEGIIGIGDAAVGPKKYYTHRLDLNRATQSLL
jgi:hypothetical protein